MFFSFKVYTKKEINLNLGCIITRHIKIQGCTESKHKTSPGIVFSKSTKQDKKILYRHDLAPVLLYKKKTAHAVFCNLFLCLVTEHQIVFMPKISARKNYQMAEDFFFQDRHSCFPLQTHVVCFSGMKHEKIRRHGLTGRE